MPGIHTETMCYNQRNYSINEGKFNLLVEHVTEEVSRGGNSKSETPPAIYSGGILLLEILVQQ
jgi:hypothetical protein